MYSETPVSLTPPRYPKMAKLVFRPTYSNMTTAHFENLPTHLCHHLGQAKQQLRIAICWFSHRDIFEVLLARLRAGVKVELLLEYDTQNVRDGGLDFQAFIKAGGQLFASREAHLMHHKFALIDDRCLLTGSFNWTYNSNAENLLYLDDASIVTAFQQEFERQKNLAKRIFQINRADLKVFAAFPLFENTRYPLSDLRKKISHGVGVWIIRLDKLQMDRADIFQKSSLPFDAAQSLAFYWTAYRIWDEALFDHEIEGLKTEMPPKSCRDLRRWARRMHIGDVLLATENKQQLWGLGIVQSHPQPYLDETFSSCRAVQWVKIQANVPYLLRDKVSGQAVAKFRGSALRVLQEVFGE